MSRFVRVITVAIAALAIVAVPAYAAYSSYIPISVTESDSTARTYLPVVASVNNSYLASNGYIDSDGLDTRVTWGGSSIQHMVADDKLLFVLPSLDADETATVNYELDHDSPLDDMPVILGYGGSVNMTDDPALELSDNFTLEWSGWVDTANGTDKNLIDKQDAFSTYVSGTGNITAVIRDATSTYLLPNADGDYTNIPYPGGSHYSLVDDSVGTPDDATTHVYTDLDDSAEVKDAYELEDDGIPSGSVIESVTVHFRYRTNAVSPNKAHAIPYLRLNGVETAGTETTVTGDTWTSFSQTLSRPGGGDWQTSDIADLQVAMGIYLDAGGGGRAQLTQVYVEVSYYPTVTATGISSGEHTVKVNTSPALKFDGNMHIDLGDFDQGFDGVNDKLTIEAWINVDDISAHRVIVAKYSSPTNRDFLFRVKSGGKLQTGYYAGDGTNYKSLNTDNAVIAAGTQYHVATTMDLATGTIKIFVNGDEKSATASVGGTPPSAFPNEAALLFIGGYNGDPFPGATNEMDGYIDEVRLYKRILGQPEIIYNYKQGREGTPQDTTDLFIWHRLDANTGTTSIDSSGNGHDGVIRGGAGWGTPMLLQVDDSYYGGSNNVTVPNNSNDYTLIESNVMPYMDYYKHYVDGSLVAWYQPVDMISGTTLPDRQGGDQDGIITWGSNPSGISAEVSGLTLAEISAPSAVSEPASPDVAAETSGTDIYDEGTASGLPGYELVSQLLAPSTGIAPIMWYQIIVLTIASLVGAGAAIFTGSLLLAGLGVGVVMIAGVSMEVLPMMTIIVYAAIAVGFVIFSKVASL